MGKVEQWVDTRFEAARDEAGTWSIEQRRTVYYRDGRGVRRADTEVERTVPLQGLSTAALTRLATAITEALAREADAAAGRAEGTLPDTMPTDLD